MVLYAGHRAWKAPTAVEALFDGEPEDWSPRMSFILDDLSRASDEALTDRALGVFGGLERLRHVIEYLALVADLEPEALQPVVQQLGPAAEETAMTLAERLREQGRERGRQEGRVEGRQEGRVEGRQEGRVEGRLEMIVRQLQLKFGPLPESVMAAIEASTEADIERWTERVLVSATLEQVFDDSPLL